MKMGEDRISGEEFAEDFEGVYVEGGFGVEFDVAEDFLCYFVADLAIKRNQHGFGKGEGHELLHYLEMVTDKRDKVLCLGTEAESDRKLQQESYMEIAEIGLDGIKEKDILLAPFEEALLGSSVLDDTIEDLAHEHRHRVLEDIVPYS